MLFLKLASLTRFKIKLCFSLVRTDGLEIPDGVVEDFIRARGELAC